jgi:transcriptional regulator with XRE-family HTH domain
MVAPEVAERFGRNLLAARRRAGFSQEELGSFAALHRTEIGLLENGRRVPRIDTVVKLAACLAIPAGDLLAGIDWVPRMPSHGSFLIRP